MVANADIVAAKVAAEADERDRIRQFLDCPCGCWAWLEGQLSAWETHYIREMGPEATPEARAFWSGMLQFARDLRTRPAARLRHPSMSSTPPSLAADVSLRPARASTGLVR